MAAFDYRMALARGLVPPIKEAQQEILKSAGGDNTFKSEAWWNEQYDKVIDKGTQKLETGTEYKTKSGDYVLGERRRYSTGGFGITGISSTMQTSYAAPKDAVITGYNPGMYFGAGTPRYDTRSVQVAGPDRKDLTQAQLNSIVADQKDQIAKTKREASKDTGKAKRKGRAVGGLLSKAKPVEVKGLATALPDLGVQSLYGSDSTLGAK